MLNIYSPEIQIVIWTWKKFYLFTINEDVLKMKNDETLNVDIAERFLANKTNEITGTHNFYDYLEILPLLPETLSCNNSVDGTGSLSMNFILSQDICKDYNLMERLPISDYEKGKKSEFDYRYLLNNSIIEKDKDYYQASEGNIFSDEILDGSNLELSDPEFIFQPLQPVWVFAKNDEGRWSKVWTGAITNVKELDTPGTTRSINIQAVNFLELTAKIPIVHEKWVNFFFLSLLPEKTQDKANWIVWLASSITPAEKSFDYLAKDVKILFKEMAIQFNRGYGLIPLNKEQEEYIVKIVKANKNFYGKIGMIKKEENLRKAIKNYYDVIERIRPYRFRFYEEENPEKNKYEGNANYIQCEYYDFIKSGYITIDDLVDKNGNIGKLMWGGEWHVSENVLAYNKIFSNTAKLWSFNYISMHNIYNRIKEVFQVNIYNDDIGNLVMDFPRFNSFPNRMVEQNENNYKDMEGERYIIQKYEGNFNFQYDIGKAVTLLTQPSNYFFDVNLNDLEHVMLTGYSWGDLDDLLTFGFSRKDMPKLFEALGLRDPVTNNIKGFLDKVAESFRNKFNADIFSGSVNLRAHADLQIGRNCLIPHKEKTYYISNKSMSWNAGSDLGVSLGLTYGKPLWKELVNPWKEYLGDLKKLQMPTQPEEPLSWLIKVNMDNVCDIMKKALPEMMQIVFNESKIDWLNKVTYLCENGMSGVESLCYMKSALYSLLEHSDNAFKSGQTIIIDPRLMYTAAAMTKKVYDNRYEEWCGKSEAEFDVINCKVLDAYPTMRLVSCPYCKEKRKKGRSLRITGVKLMLYDFQDSETMFQDGMGKKHLLFCKKNPIIIDIKYHSEDPIIHKPITSPASFSSNLSFFTIPITIGNKYHYEKMIENVENFFEKEEGSQFGVSQNRLNPEQNKENPLGSYDLSCIGEKGIIEALRVSDELRRLYQKIVVKNIKEEEGKRVKVKRSCFCEDSPDSIDEGKHHTKEEVKEKTIEGKYGEGSLIKLEPNKNYLIYHDFVFTNLEKGFLEKIYDDEILVSLGTPWIKKK